MRRLALALVLLAASITHAQDEEMPASDETPPTARRPSDIIFGGPDAVDVQIDDDISPNPNFLGLNVLEGYFAFKKEFAAKTGLTFGGDYTAAFFTATDGPGTTEASSGIIRLFGRWDLVGRGTDDIGGIIYKFEHRHRYGNIAPKALASNLGYAGLIEPPFSNQGLRATNLYWRQSFFEGGLVTYVGFLDPTDFVDVYALASPWTGFANFVFSTGSATIGVPNDAALGAMLGGWITNQLYVMGSLVDANADPTSPFEGFETLFGDFDVFTTLEIGWTPSRDRFFLDNAHLTFWHTDPSTAAGTPDGWGVNLSGSLWLDEQWLPFLRAGWADRGGSLLEASVSAGIGWQRQRGGSVLGLGLNWGRPNSDTFGPGLDDQFTTELFFRWQVAEHLQVTPSVQLLVNPALNPFDEVIGVFGIRARLAF